MKFFQLTLVFIAIFIFFFLLLSFIAWFFMSYDYSYAQVIRRGEWQFMYSIFIGWWLAGACVLEIEKEYF